MKTIRYAAFFALLLPIHLLSQVAADVVVPITVTTTTTPSVILNWPTPAAGVTEVIVARKQLFETSWSLLAQLPPTATTFTDVGIGIGQAREYLVLENGGTPAQRIGLVYAGQDIPAFTGSRGKMVLVVDNALSMPLATELARYEQDLRGDGWQVLRHNIDAGTSTVPSVKALLRADWEADPNTLCVLLFGNIPVPYSGNIAPDGHSEHLGAWPTDYYYGDFDEELWTDTLVNNTLADRDANDNVPGDGKFDQSQTPSLPEVIVGRVDFSNLNGWSVSQTELYRRYLNKNHAFRTGAYKPQNKTLVDDNFGYTANGEAFAQNGWRNGDAITGPSNVQAGDFFNDTDNQSFLLGYGCGGGTYTSADGVGTSDNFKTDSVNVVFSMLFGSYFGDWDSENNPFMPSALASKGGILTCTWAGRPNWHMHHMALGDPIWLSTYWTWLNSFLTYKVYPPNYGADLIHVSLLGDPTLRAHSVKPPPAATASATCTGVNLAWTASTDAALGYYVYRSPSLDSVFQLITPSPVLTTAFTDASPLSGANFYQVKSLKKEVVPTGSYFNQSIGTAAQATFNGLPQAAATATNVDCNGGSDGSVALSVNGGNPGYTYAWSNSATTQNLNNLSAGTFTVIVSDQLGCTATATATVTQPNALVIQPVITNVSCFGADDGNVQINVTGGTPPYTYTWSNDLTGQTGSALISGPSSGETVSPDFTSPIHTDLAPGTYTVTVTDAHGCTQTATATVTQPQLLVGTATATIATCNGASNGTIALVVTGGTPTYHYNWADLPGSNDPKDRSGLPADSYSVIITDTHGCTASAAATVLQPPLITLQTSITNASCNPLVNGSIDLTVGGGIFGFTYLWSNGATTQDLASVQPGVYTVTVTDGNNCSKTTSATVTQTNSNLNGQMASSPALCFGQASGSVNLTIFGGTSPFTYLWSNGATTEDLLGVPQGNYSVTVTDANNCQFGSGVGVQQPPPVITNTVATSALCAGTATGSLVVTVSGGTPGYSFLWDNGATTQNLSNVPAGFYIGTVTDSNGCTKSYGNTVMEPTPLLAAASSVNPSCFGENTGSATMTPSGGTSPYTFIWSNNGVTSTISNLPPGNFGGTITDANGCTATVSVTLSQPTPVIGNFETTDILCFGDEATLTVSSISGGAGAPYLYSLDNGPLISPDISIAIGDGPHSIQFYDALTCSTGIDFIMNTPGVLSTSLVITSTSCSGAADGAIAVVVQGGVSPYSYLWSNGATTQAINNLATGPYSVTITDANGCTLQASGSVFGPPPFEAPISGAETACVGVPESYSLSAGLSNYNWITNANGEVTQGQGSSNVTIQWTSEGLNQLLVLFDDINGCPDTSVFWVVTTICVGTHDLSEGSVKVQPNPFSDQLAIRFESNFQAGARLRLFDVQGRLMLEQTLTSPEFSLETGALPSGTYFLQIVENERTGVWKVIKQN